MQYAFLPGFNASWISRFKAEDERLFFSGMYPIRIQSIRIRSTKQKFETFINSLLYLDTLVTGGPLDRMTLTDDELFIILGLMSGALNPNETSRCFDDYIHSTFDAFTRSKKQIVLYLGLLNQTTANKKVLDLFLNTLDERDVTKEEEMKRECDDLRNLWKPQ
eukprot:983362_1